MVNMHIFDLLKAAFMFILYITFTAMSIIKFMHFIITCNNLLKSKINGRKDILFTKIKKKIYAPLY